MDWDRLETPAVGNALMMADFQVCRAPDPATALLALRSGDFEILLAPASAALEGTSLVEAALRYDPRLRVIVASEAADVAQAAVSMSQGAFDHLLRPIGAEQALGAIESAWAAFCNTAPSGETTTRPLDVLVIDATPPRARALEQVLAQEHDLRCVTVRCLAQGLARLRERRFDAVLWNVGGNRADTLCGVHELCASTNPPALILIAPHDDDTLRDRAMRLGVQDVVCRQRLGREAPGARLHMAVLRDRHRLQQNRTFARIDSSEVTMVDLNECVNAACKIAMSEIRPRARLIQELGELPRVPGSQGKLAQVITNLLVNAAQAIAEGQPDDNRISVRTGASEGGVWCQVQDTGRGILPEARDKIFDPFFTNKPIGQGTGMGLALCADIVRQHQGTIRALEAPSGGTLFEVQLPLASPLEPAAPARATSSLPPSSTSQLRPRAVTTHPLRLLLIDDEPLVLRSLRRMLARHHVDVAAGGAEALAKLGADSDYDLIFCDLMMPGIDGAAVYAAMAQRFPHLLERLVFCSGGAFTPRTKSFLEQSTQPLVEKPLTPESFSEIAQRVLSRTRLRLVRGGDA